MALILNWPNQCHWSVRGRAGCWVLHCLFSHRVEEDWVCNISINAKYFLHNNTFYHHWVLTHKGITIHHQFCVKQQQQQQQQQQNPKPFPICCLLKGNFKKTVTLTCSVLINKHLTVTVRAHIYACMCVCVRACMCVQLLRTIST